MSGIIYPINDKKYTAEDVEIFNCTRTSGVYSVLDFDSVFAGNTVTVGKGLAWIKNGDFSGKAVAFTEETNLTFEAAETASDRYDVIAVRYDAAKKEPEMLIIKGSPSDSPKIPTRSTETYLYDLYLYAILRKGGETVISEENITDLRENEEYCGIMRDSVTSGIAPVYETITDERWDVGEIRYFDPEKYEFLIAEIHTTIATENVILTRSSSHADAEYYSGIGFYRGKSNPLYYYAQIKINGNSNELVLCSFVTDMSDDIPETGSNAHITKLVGALKQPEGYVKVDDMYNPKSHNAQSGKAVGQAIDEALEGFEMPQNVENTDNKISNIDENSTDEQYPSAKAVKISLDKQASETNVKFEKLNEDLTMLSTKTEINISDVSAEVTNNKTQIENTEEKVDLLKTNVDLLNEGGLLLKEDFIGNQVNSWLDEHPEATTTVQDNSLTSNKMNSEMKEWIRSNAINVKDFGAVGDGVADDTEAIKNAFATLGDYGYIVFPKGHYIVKPTANKQSFIKLTGLKNVTVDLNGSTIEVATNGYPYYNLFELIDCENFVITNGFLKGDRLTHDYTTISGTHEFGYGIQLRSSLTSGETPSDTLKCGGKIENCNIYDFTGDGIVTKNGLSPAIITVQNCEIHHCRRQGISILDSDTVIVDNCHIHHIGTFDGINGTKPMSGIDIEPLSGTKTVNLIHIKNTKIEYTPRRSIVCVTPKTYETVDGVKVLKEIKNNIKKIVIDNCETELVVIDANKTFDISEEQCTDILIKNSVLKHTIIEEKYQPFVFSGATVIGCVINANYDYDYANTDLFGNNLIGGKKTVLKGCILNLTNTAFVRYVEITDTTVNGGVLKVTENLNKPYSTLWDCTNVNFNGCSFDIPIASGLYKFIGCSFKDCVPFGTSKPLKFYNCYLDTKYVPGANYVNCVIEDEI